MAITISTALRNHIANSAFNGAAGVNFDGGKLRAWTGTAPGVNDAPTGTLLFSVPLPADAFGAASTGVVAKAGTWEDTSADGTGTATYFRLTQSDDNDGASGGTYRRVQGSVGEGSGDLSLDAVAIVAGDPVPISTFTVTVPAG
jgi:hypothetical protein